MMVDAGIFDSSGRDRGETLATWGEGINYFISALLLATKVSLTLLYSSDQLLILLVPINSVVWGGAGSKATRNFEPPVPFLPQFLVSYQSNDLRLYLSRKYKVVRPPN